MSLNASHIYFIGIGGIGMSALARYFKAKGAYVCGYDRSPSHVTQALEQEGIEITYEDNPENCPWPIELAIYTPAIPADNKILNHFRNDEETPLLKRSEVLAQLANAGNCIAVAGTHGKTTTSSMLAHIFMNSASGCTAFIGGISNNYKGNYIHSGENSNNIIVEADEYDRSFLRLLPHSALITSTDADHLDIYNSHGELLKAFNEFANQIKDEGILLLKYGLQIKGSAKCFTYHPWNSEADFSISHYQIDSEGYYEFDVQCPDGTLKAMRMKAMGKINLENAVGAIALARLNGIEESAIRRAMESYAGVYRRFDYRIQSPDLVLIDDYAHHPEELAALLQSVDEIYPGKKICCVFQPHLYSRTRDFADGFAKTLAQCDNCILLDIYPAREKPIEGVSAQMILDRMPEMKKQLCSKEMLADLLAAQEEEIFILAGAGDIDKLTKEVEQKLLKKLIN